MIQVLAVALVFQTPAVFDQGTFSTTMNGTEIAREGFRILENGKSSSILYTIADGVATVSAKTEFMTGPKGLESALINIVNGPSTRLSTQNNVLMYSDGRRVQAGGRPIYAVESFCWHNFTHIFRAYEAGGTSQTFQVILPSERVQTNFVLIRGGHRTVNGETRIDWNGTLDGVAHEFTTDAQGRIQSIRIPSKNIIVVRLAPGAATGRPTTSGVTEPISPSVEDMARVMPNRDSYTEREARIFGTGTVALYGSLTSPKGRDKHPAVVLISGAGPSDRNWNSPPLVTGSPGAQIADALTAAGFVVFRYDDRGVGKSGGAQNSATFWNLVSDARSIVAWVKAQPEVDPFNVFVAGHGEGALIALILGAEDPTLGGVISIAGPGKPLDKVIMESLNAMAVDENTPASERERAARMIPKMNEIVAKAKAGERGVIEGINLPWLREHLEVNPAEYAARQRGPLFIIQGLDDLTVLSRNANELKEAAMGNEVDTTVELIARMNHSLMWVRAGNPDFDPNWPTRVVPRVYEAMIGWLHEKAKRP